MTQSRIKDGNYYVVQSFMVKDLKLKGLEKDVYAIIYGFTQGENQRFTGSLQYLADWCCSTKQGILKVLKSLVEKGLIIREEKKINNVNFVEYYTTEFNTPIKQNLTEGIKQSLTNNIDYKIDNNIKHKYGEYQHVLLTDEELNKLKELYSNWQELITYLDEYIEMKGYKAKSHYLCIRKWVVDAVKRKNNSKSFQSRTYNEKDINNLFDNIDEIEL